MVYSRIWTALRAPAGQVMRWRIPQGGATRFRPRCICTSRFQNQIRVEDQDNYIKPDFEPPDKRLSTMKDPTIPEGHPIDTDGRPLGLIVPDYDVELPAFSFGGYAKDFQAWEKEPPTYPPTSWPEVAQYDYEELQVAQLPKAYEVNLLIVAYILGAAGFLLSVIGTRWETTNYYKKYSHFYSTGWPCFHYEPNLDIVPLVPRDDGLPPETLMLSFVDRGDLWKEVPPDDLPGDESDEDDNSEDDEDNVSNEKTD